jgi:xylulokinase
LYLLGIDAGTTGLKAVLFDEKGKEIAIGRAEYSLIIPRANMAELDANSYWTGCIRAISEIFSKSKTDPAEIKALAISSQGETLIPIDKKGNPLMRAIVWLDNRSEKESEIIRRGFGVETIFEKTGQPEVAATWPATKILWLKRNKHRLFNKCYKYLLVEDFLIHKLTGQFATEYSIVSSTLYFDIQKETWWREMLDFIGIDNNQLPELMYSGKIVGGITDQASRETGLSTNTIVSTGAFDHAAGAIGAGNIKPGIVTETTGGSLALAATTDRPEYDPKRRIPCHHHALKKTYFLLPWCQTAGILLKWFRDEFGHAEKEAAERMKIDTYDILTLEASRINAGSDGLVILPHFMGAGPPEFDPGARGVFFGLTLGHTKAHIIRAILESIAFMLRRNVELMEELGIEVREIRSLGGASRSPLWNQIKSDVTSRTILTFQTEEAASLGAAILAGVAGGHLKSVDHGCATMVQPKRRYNPNFENRRVYDKLYGVYSILYTKTKDVFPHLIY